MDLECHICKKLTKPQDVGNLFGNWSFFPFMLNYQFTCSQCSGGQPAIRRFAAAWDSVLVTVIANLTAAQQSSDDPKQRFYLHEDIIPFISKNFDSICTNRARSSGWMTKLDGRFRQYPEIFVCDDSSPPGFCFTEKYQDLSLCVPSLFDAVLKHERRPDIPSKPVAAPTAKLPGTRAAKRKNEITQATSKRTRTGATPKLPVNGYPTEHPHNKDGYRYILAELDPKTSEADLDAYAGKALPGFLYRVVTPPTSLLALHDRAPQLKVSDDRLTVTGDKGYCMIRGSHGVSHGQWYYEIRVTELPDPSGCRVGWAQSLGQLQAPCGYDKFSYAWRSRKGTFFHQSKGEHYCDTGYGVGDVLGILIDLPNNIDPQKHLPPTHKDKALIRFKNFLYYEEKDYVEREEKALTKLPGSKIVCFKNGINQGVAREGVFEGRYYPAVSLFKNATIVCNFGPTFECPPEDGTTFRPMCEAADQCMVEQAMADMLFHVEKEVDGEAEILRKAEENGSVAATKPALNGTKR